MLLYDDSFDSSAIEAIAYDSQAQALFVFLKTENVSGAMTG